MRRDRLDLVANSSVDVARLRFPRRRRMIGVVKRYRMLRWELDSRANVLATEIKEEWEPKVKETWIENKRIIRERILHEFGVTEADRKTQNMIELQATPFSFVAFHNKFLRQIRTAFVMSAYYPALTGACALGERILNHLILTLRDDFRATPEFKKVYGKDSFDDWGIALEVLSNWNVLLPEAALAFGKLKEDRNDALHFRPETDVNDRALALEAINRVQQIVNCQFSAFKGPWYIPKIRGAAYVRRQAEAEPFVKRIVLPNCVLVGPKHRLEHATAVWKVIDSEDYDNREITDEEFARLVDPH